MVDNDSQDQSAAHSAAAGARVVREPHQGYGNAILAGIEAAQGDIIILGDGDGEHDLGALEPLWEKLQDGCDFVFGNRFSGRSNDYPGSFLRRYVGNPLLSGAGKLFLRAPVGDFHCGLRGFRAASVRALELQSPGMELASEMIAKAIRGNMRIAEVPVMQHRAIDPDRASHLRIWRDGWRHLRLLLLLSPRWLFLYPGALLFVAGVVLMAVPIIHLVEEGGGFGAYTMLFGSVFVVSGGQVVLFSLLASAFYANIGLIDGYWRGVIHRKGVPEALFVGGFALALLGMAGSVWSLFVWAQTGTAAIEARLRVAIPSVALLILGVQLMFSISFLALLVTQTRSRARVKKPPTPRSLCSDPSRPAKDGPRHDGKAQGPPE